MEQNPKSIKFRNDLNGADVTLTPENCKEFNVSGAELFKSYTINISQSQVEMANLGMGADSSFITANVFLRMLAIGNNASLGNYIDDIKTRYYIIEKPQKQPYELIYRIYYNSVNSNYYQTDNVFRDQLQELSQKYNPGNAELTKLIANASYSELDLIKVLKLLNTSFARNYASGKLIGFRWFIGLSAGEDKLTLKGPVPLPASINFSPQFSAGADVLLNKNIQKLFFRLEFNYTQDQFSFFYAKSADTYYAIPKFKQHNFSFSPQVVYNIYNSQSVKFYIDGGASLNLSNYSAYSFEQTLSGFPADPQPDYPPLYKFWFSFPFKAGLILNKKVDISFGYAFPVQLTDDMHSQFDGQVSGYHVGVKYLFGVK